MQIPEINIKIRIIATVVIALSVLSAKSQNINPDSVTFYRTLEELTVTGHNTTLIKNGISAIPTKRERTSSNSGISLLERMQIPLLVINPADKKITMNTGEEIRYFINGIEATKEDVAGIMPIEVKRVEVLRRPIDPRFDGAEAAVNFIVKKIKHGGYVMADAKQSFILNKGSYTLYSKYDSGEWNFQLAGGASYINTENDSSILHATYSFNDVSPITHDIVSHTDRKRQRQYYGAFQAIKNFQSDGSLTLKTGIRTVDNPELAKNGKNNINGQLSEYTSNATTRLISPYFRTSYVKKTNHGLSMKIEGAFSASFNKGSSIYATNGTTTANNIKEHSLSPSLSIKLNKTVSPNDEISLSAKSIVSVHKTTYGGTAVSTQRLVQQDYDLGIDWDHYFLSNWMMQLSAGIPISVLDINRSIRHTDLQPTATLYSNIKFAGKHSVSLLGSYRTDPRILTSMNEVERNDSPYEGTAGNTGLESSKQSQLSLSYTWLARNNIQASFATNLSRCSNAVVTGYYLHEGVIFNHYINSGNVDKASFRINWKLSVAGGRLSVSPQFMITQLNADGIYPFNFWQPEAAVTVTYMPLNNLYAMLYASTPSTKVYYESNGGYTNVHNGMLYLQFGYNHANISMTATFIPFYGSSHDTSVMKGSNVDIVSNQWLSTGKRRIEIGLQYTLPFGKKVAREKLWLENNTITTVR